MNSCALRVDPSNVATPAASARSEHEPEADKTRYEEDSQGDDPRLLTNRAHHASCSPTASPRRLIATRVGRSRPPRVYRPQSSIDAS